MDKCEHEIGIYYDYDDTNTITLPELKEKVKQDKESEKHFKENYNNLPKDFCRYTKLEEYLDRRKNTALVHFNYCPYCGEKLDWKAMRKESKEC